MHEMVGLCWDGARDLLQSLAGRKKRNASTLFLCLICFFFFFIVPARKPFLLRSVVPCEGKLTSLRHRS